MGSVCHTVGQCLPLASLASPSLSLKWCFFLEVQWAPLLLLRHFGELFLQTQGSPRSFGKLGFSEWYQMWVQFNLIKVSLAEAWLSAPSQLLTASASSNVLN